MVIRDKGIIPDKRTRVYDERESPLFSHRGLRGSASHPRPTDEVRLELATLHTLLRERERSLSQVKSGRLRRDRRSLCR
jgi:hypothetical protein